MSNSSASQSKPRWRVHIREWMDGKAPEHAALGERLLTELAELVPDSVPLPTMDLVQDGSLVCEWRLAGAVCVEAVALPGEPTEAFVCDGERREYDVLTKLADDFRSVLARYSP